MKLKTKFFGEIELIEDKIIYFDEGIPGFESLRKFLYMSDNDTNSPFCWLQSIDDIDIVFTMMDLYSVLKVIPDYDANVNKISLSSLGEFEEEDLLVYFIANIPKEVRNMTINLKAPIIIVKNKGIQAVCDNENYPIKYYIYNEMKKI